MKFLISNFGGHALEVANYPPHDSYGGNVAPFVFPSTARRHVRNVNRSDACKRCSVCREELPLDVYP